jgi:Domain of unknown function (DUF4342)
MSGSGANGGAASGSAEEEPVGGVGEERTWRVRTERLRVTSGDLWGKLRQLVHEGNVRRIIIRGSDERVLIDIPVTVGVVGAVLAPFAVAVAALAAVATRCTIEVERVEQEAPAAEADAATGADAAAESGAEADGTGTQTQAEAPAAQRVKKTKS